MQQSNAGKNMWNERYSKPGFAYGKEPNDFLVLEFKKIPRGKVLCLAEGEGRNAVFLAQQGYQVTAVDQSSVGLEKVRILAREKGVEVRTVIADLQDFEIKKDAWDGIVSIFAHVPSTIRKRIHIQAVDGLKSGGVFILEAFTIEQLDMDSVGGPPASQSDLFMSLVELRQELTGLEFDIAQEIKRAMKNGKHHAGMGAVVQITALK
jgi:SAM-dependent methyltransferase